MTETVKPLLCRLGLHRWRRHRHVTPYPALGWDFEYDVQTCRRCGRERVAG